MSGTAPLLSGTPLPWAAGLRIPARVRIPTYAVWETVVFALNILAFIFIGLQLGPILDTRESGVRGRYLLVAAAVLVTVIVVRVAWQMSFNAAVQLWHRRFGFTPERPLLRPTTGTGLVIAWAGMRGIVSLAAALALPAGFPFRDLILLTTFCVVVGTLVIQGLTLKPLLRWLDLRDDDPVSQEARVARGEALRAGLASLEREDAQEAASVREELEAHLSPPDDSARGVRRNSQTTRREVRVRAIAASRAAVLAMRARHQIGDDAFHRVEEDLDWLSMAGGNDQPE